MTPPPPDDSTVKELVQQHWDGRAATFDEESQHGIHTSEQHDEWLSVLHEWTGDEPLDVLDVGCGTGVISLLLAELGHDVVGVDFARAMLDRARAKGRETDHPIPFSRGDADTLPIRDGTFDLVTARHLVWTLPNPEAAINEWQRVVRPDGRIIMIEGYWDHDEPWDEYEEMHDSLPLYDGRPPDELRALLEREGLAGVTHERLHDSILWGREPQHERFIMGGTVSG